MKAKSLCQNLMFHGLFLLYPILIYAQSETFPSELSENFNIALHVDYKYIIQIPVDLEPDEKLPLMVFLHGSGERGDSVDLVKMHGPWEFLENHPEYRFILLAPQCKTDQYWDARSLSFLIDHIISRYPVDTTRIFLTGLSMGGYGTWDLAILDPSRFAAIAPVCGTTFLHKLMAHKVKNLPIWIFHGAMDETVPFQNSVKMAQKLKELGADVKFTVYPFTTHNAWDEAYADEQLYKWFLSCKKQ
jgi:predicted peptidase